MDNCELCGRTLYVKNGESVSALNSLAVYRELTLTCKNSECKNFDKAVSVKRIPENQAARDEDGGNN